MFILQFDFFICTRYTMKQNERKDLDEDEIFDHITENFEGDSLLAVGDEELIKIHFHTNRPWEILEYGASLGEIHDIVVENMLRQAEGLKG